MTEHKARPEPWQADAARWLEAILELRDRVQVLEDAAQKHIVETSSNIEALFRRIESLEAAERPASKVYEISEALQLTPEQAQQLMDLLTPNSKPSPNSSQIGSSLVERIEDALTECVREQGSMARAAIREVAAWLREQQDGDLVAATVLEREAER
jgi:hypothetical protein